MIVSKLEQKQFEKITRKLDSITRLLAMTLVENIETVESKVEFLHNAGFKPNGIANILNKKHNNIDQVLHNIRKKQENPEN